MGTKLDLEQTWMLSVAAFGIIVILLLILIIILFAKVSKMKKRYTALMNGQNEVNLEELITSIQDRVNVQKEHGSQLERQVTEIINTIRTMKSKVGIIRYSAFGDAGGNDLSFSIAMLNEQADGLVLTGIYGRDQTYIYAKPVVRGESTYTLSPEEKDTITQTMQPK